MTTPTQAVSVQDLRASRQPTTHPALAPYLRGRVAEPTLRLHLENPFGDGIDPRWERPRKVASWFLLA